MTNIRENVQLYYKKIFHNHMAAGTSGNVSFYDREKDIVYITPSSVDPFIMQQSDIVLIDLDGNTLEETAHKPSSEWRVHTELYKRRPDISAVVHTHSPYATAFSIINKPIPCALIEMVAFTNSAIPVSPYAKNGTQELADLVAETMTGRMTCLMQSHGAVAADTTLEKAYIRACYIEDAAKICAIAASIDGDRVAKYVL